MKKKFKKKKTDYKYVYHTLQSTGLCQHRSINKNHCAFASYAFVLTLVSSYNLVKRRTNLANFTIRTGLYPNVAHLHHRLTKLHIECQAKQAS